MLFECQNEINSLATQLTTLLMHWKASQWRSLFNERTKKTER